MKKDERVRVCDQILRLDHYTEVPRQSLNQTMRPAACIIS